jgi:hypothetical protein
MSITTTKTLGNSLPQKKSEAEPDFVNLLTVSTVVKTMLEIIKIKKIHIMDKETIKQFPMIAKVIILLAEQTQ